MPTIVTEAPYRPVPTNPPRKRWTRAECAAFQATGLWDQQRLELVEGELINKMGKNRPHAVVAITVRNWLIAIFGLSYVETDDPIDVAPHDNPTSEPEPDIIVLVRPATEFERNPQPVDLRLVVEISDSTVGFDLTTKAGLYARAGITDYWVFDIGARRLLIHRDPHHGKYQSITAYSEHESVAPLAAPESRFRVGDAFPA
ncbi:MAG: Uma2 family endonuclease [Acidobacteriia bacterium]|nr:Uma2 family endonuclease [Terriglobia bacterium]